MGFAVIARYVCAPEDADDIRAALLAVREGTLAEPANLTYVVHEETDSLGGTAFILYEQYVDRAGFEAHTKAAHFAELVGAIRPRLRERTVHFAEVL